MPARLAKSVCVAEPLVIRRCVPRKQARRLLSCVRPLVVSHRCGHPGRAGRSDRLRGGGHGRKIGKVDEATNDVGSSHVVVDTGPWIFGKKVMLPAGTIVCMDPPEQTVY